MTEYVADVRVMLKPSVNDPQGLSIRNALHTLGFPTVKDVRAGKFLQITVEVDGEGTAREAARAMAEKLLANPVIEVYEISISRLAVTEP